MNSHRFQAMSSGRLCEQCGHGQDHPKHYTPPVDLNPSDEKLREIIVLKDLEIKRLNNSATKKDHEFLCTIAEKDAEIARLYRPTGCTLGVGTGAGHLFVHGDYESVKAAQAIIDERSELAARNKSLDDQLNVTLTKLNQAEIENANLRQKLEAAEKQIVSLESSTVIQALIATNNYSNNPAQAVIRLAKDAERYRKLKASEYFERLQIKANEHCWQFVLFDNNPNFDKAIDSLPEVES